MKVTKYEHACLVLEQNGESLIIDPGNYTRPMTNTSNVQAIVITHMHDDHCFEEQVDAILKDNPDITIYGTDEVCKRLAPRKTIAVHHGDHIEAGSFTLEFVGDMHAEIHRSIPLIQNCGVLVNNFLYYPGDSFTRPDRPVELLAAPSSAPWAKISEMMDFVNEVKPKRCFPTHNVHLSEIGHQMYNGRIKAATESHGGEFFFIQPGESQEF
jgi:L-ascorbate metabolism protein UlaG (beta-lactamase superfamily)